ncbi:MAG: response regulator transcription factor [Xanthomonadaceae bacterium]|nr:response regulator transcription factor [Xanthomonadaceae bacterium]MDE1957484.1 response regulator transcription factor [Xanthomonadaceae bacterium]MDE2177377.1 response regulator transcription factor [Xanthomonadaceae bacterium]MDE2245355.1 response regulator transcription factor [Xanthomonadaceae bacterium]
MRILVVEDDSETRSWIARGLAEQGYRVTAAEDGHEALYQATEGDFDALVVDRMLPKLDGLALVRALRAAAVRTPVLMLTALAETPQRVEGLNAGADDYLGKPFAFTELVARLQALARRPPLTVQSTMLETDDLRMDLARREVSRGGQVLDLTPTEFRLLECLLRNAGKVVTRTMLLEQVWHFHFDPRTSVVETHMSRLRTKLDRGYEDELIETVRGVGYRVRAFRPPA